MEIDLESGLQRSSRTELGTKKNPTWTGCKKETKLAKEKPVRQKEPGQCGALSQRRKGS